MFSEWELLPETTARLREVDAALSDLIDLGDFSIETIEEIAKMSMPDRISDTLAIESIVVGRRVTSAVLQGNALGDIDGYTKQAILNISIANEHIEKRARTGSELDAETIKVVNQKVMHNLGEVKEPGNFRGLNVQITGAEVQPPWWTDVPTLVEEGLDFLKGLEQHPVYLAAYAHWLIAHIHPFENGNGRTARMIQDLLLLSSRFLPVGIPQEMRAAYYEALADADNGDGNELIQLIANAELGMIYRTIEVGKQQERRREGLDSFVERILQAGTAAQLGKFEKWTRKVETLRGILVDDFNSLTLRSKGFVTFRNWTESMPTLDEWQEIAKNGKPWYKQILRFEVYGSQGFLLKGCMYVRRHDMRDALEPTRHLRDAVAVFVDICDEKEGRYDFHRPKDDPFVTTREFIPRDKDWVVFSDQSALAGVLPEDVYFQLYNNKWISAEVASAAEIITDFTAQLQRKIGI